MVALILSRKDLLQVLDMDDVIQVLERAFKDLATGNAVAPPRTGIELPEKDTWFGVMPSYVKGLGYFFSTKIVSIANRNISKNLPTTQAVVVLNDPETGDVLSIMDGTFITAMRTGGMGGLAAKYLSTKDSRIVGMFGAGVQARTQLVALKRVRNISLAKVYDPLTDRAKSFAQEMEKTLGIPVSVSRDPSENVKGCNIVVTVSTSKEPLFDGRDVEAGTHVNAFGTFKPTERELDSEIIRRSKVAVDQREAALAEAGDLIIPMKEGIISEDHILADMGEIVLAKKLVRESDSDLTIFKAVGLGIQDCAAAALAYKKAMDQGIGTRVEVH